MLFGKIVAVYYENPTEDTDTLCGQNAESYILAILRAQIKIQVNTSKLKENQTKLNTGKVYNLSKMYIIFKSR
jgi:hypothetical protein